VLAVGLAVALLLAGDSLMHWLGAGRLDVSTLAVALTGLCLALNLQETVVSQVCLVPLHEVGAMARITGVGSLIGRAVVTAHAATSGTVGALLGVVVGLTFRLVLCGIVIRRSPLYTSSASLRG